MLHLNRGATLRVVADTHSSLSTTETSGLTVSEKSEFSELLAVLKLDPRLTCASVPGLYSRYVNFCSCFKQEPSPWNFVVG